MSILLARLIVVICLTLALVSFVAGVSTRDQVRSSAVVSAHSCSSAGPDRCNIIYRDEASR